MPKPYGKLLIYSESPILKSILIDDPSLANLLLFSWGRLWATQNALQDFSFLVIWKQLKLWVELVFTDINRGH